MKSKLQFSLKRFSHKFNKSVLLKHTNNKPRDNNVDAILPFVIVICHSFQGIGHTIIMTIEMFNVWGFW